MLTGVMQVSTRKFGQALQYLFLTRNLADEPLHLLLQGAEEKISYGCQFGAQHP